jgi:hypothetical protein
MLTVEHERIEMIKQKESELEDLVNSQPAHVTKVAGLDHNSPAELALQTDTTMPSLFIEIGVFLTFLPMLTLNYSPLNVCL